jgi:hypothetical protein
MHQFSCDLFNEEQTAACLGLKMEEYWVLRPDEHDIRTLLYPSANREQHAYRSMNLLRARISSAMDCLNGFEYVLGPNGMAAVKRLFNQSPGSALLFDCLGRIERMCWLAWLGFSNLNVPNGAAIAKVQFQMAMMTDPPGSPADKLEALNDPPWILHGINASIWLCRQNWRHRIGYLSFMPACHKFTTRPAEALRFMSMKLEDQEEWLEEQRILPDIDDDVRRELVLMDDVEWAGAVEGLWKRMWNMTGDRVLMDDDDEVEESVVTLEEEEQEEESLETPAASGGACSPCSRGKRPAFRAGFDAGAPASKRARV